MHLSFRSLAGVLTSSLLAVSMASAHQRRPRTPTPAPTPPQTPKPTTPQQPPAGMPGMPTGRPGFMMAAPGPKPYDQVVTKEAKTQVGLFKVHRIKDQILFEIPPAMLGRELMMSVQIVRTPPIGGGLFAAGLPIAGDVLKFEKRNDRILMRFPNYSVRTKDEASLAYGLVRSSVEPIIDSFDVLAYAKDGSAVIDVTKLYDSDPAEFSVGPTIGGVGVDPTRSYIESVDTFPTNVEVESQLTFRSLGAGRGGAPAETAFLHYSLLALPEHPMQARLKDSRIGYFSTFFTQYSRNHLEGEQIGYIDRFRLEKKDPSAAVSEPVKPITFYIERDVPAKWRPYIHQAVEAWNGPFEQAGFKNAIIAKDAPTEKQDPTWHAGDLRYSLISWSPSTTQNAEGLHIADPRSGETLHAHVVLWHDVLKLSQNWYFVQASPNDPSSQKLPLSDATIGDIIRYIVTHEVGHTLGLEHNFIASSAYTVPQLRSKEFTEKYGDEASVMDYGRFNYVAQPGDGARLIPIIGPYDYFAIKYGYMPTTAKSPEGEKSTLDAFLAKQVDDVTVRFGNSDRNDPHVETEDLGSDPVAASTMGLKNLDRVMGYLMPAATTFGQDYTDLAAMYRQVLSQRFLELNHVARLVGGVYHNDPHVGRGGVVYEHVSKAKQAEAVAFLVDKGLNMDPVFYNKAILDRTQSDGFLDLNGTSQQALLTTLLAESRVSRMLDNEAENGDQAYTVSELVSQVQAAVWSELHSPSPKVTIARRNLQLKYLQLMDTRLNGGAPSKSEFRAIARLALKNLRGAIVQDLPKVKDAATQAHLEAERDFIKDILDGKTVQPAAAANPFAFLLGLDQPSFCPIDDARPYFEGLTDK